MKILRVVLLFLLSVSGWASSQVRADDILDNKSIIALHQLGLGETVIIDKIKTSRCNFDTSVDGLKQIKAENVSDSVISAMIMAPSQGAAPAAASAPAPAPAAAVPSGDPNDPTSMHEPGVWLLQDKGGTKAMTKLEPSVISKVESGGGAMWGMAWGATAKSRADLNGASATLQVGERKPTFYFYFDARDQSDATSPAEFVLAQMEVRKKDDERRMVVGQMNAYSGSKSGPDQKDVRKTSFDRLAPGIYKVSPQNDLVDGEYAFYYAGSAPIVGYYFVMGTGGKLFDFGVKGQ